MLLRRQSLADRAFADNTLVDVATNCQSDTRQGSQTSREENLEREVGYFGAAERQAIDTLLRHNCDQQTVAADSGNIDQTNVGKGMLQQQA
jgi:hypothetical protein